MDAATCPLCGGTLINEPDVFGRALTEATPGALAVVAILPPETRCVVCVDCATPFWPRVPAEAQP